MKLGRRHLGTLLVCALWVLTAAPADATCWYCVGEQCETVTGGMGNESCYQETNYAPDGTIQRNCQLQMGSCQVSGGGGGLDCGWDWSSWGWHCFWNPAN